MRRNSFVIHSSKHPEIVSADEYCRYLRQLAEKIKNATLKVEKALESDEMGLQVTDEWPESGRTIWCSKSKQDAMSEEETKKAIEHQEKLQKRFFDEKSNDYVGISEGEFRSSKEILEHIETFLNKKAVPPGKPAGQKVSFGVKFGAFMLQWVWLFIVVSIAL